MKRTEEKLEKISIFIPKSLLVKISAYGAFYGIGRQEVINKILSEFFDNQNDSSTPKELTDFINKAIEVQKCS